MAARGRTQLQVGLMHDTCLTCLKFSDSHSVHWQDPADVTLGVPAALYCSLWFTFLVLVIDAEFRPRSKTSLTVL